MYFEFIKHCTKKRSEMPAHQYCRPTLLDCCRESEWLIRASCMRPLDKNRKNKRKNKGERERGGEDARTVTADSEGGGGRSANLPTSRSDMAQHLWNRCLLVVYINHFFHYTLSQYLIKFDVIFVCLAVVSLFVPVRVTCENKDDS